RPYRQTLYLLRESLLHRLPRIPTFLCSLKVKGTANRVVEAKGHVPCDPRDKFSTTTRSHDSTKFSRPCDDNLIDYCGTRTPDGTSSLFFLSTMRRLVRLLRYSNSGRDTLTIFSRP